MRFVAINVQIAGDLKTMLHYKRNWCLLDLLILQWSSMRNNTFAYFFQKFC